MHQVGSCLHNYIKLHCQQSTKFSSALNCAVWLYHASACMHACMHITFLFMQFRAIISNVCMTVYSSVQFNLEIYCHIYYILIFCYDSIYLVGLGFLIVDVSRTHSDTPQSVGLLWTNYHLITETTTWQHTTVWNDRHPMNMAGFELAIPEIRPRQINASDRAVVGIGYYISYAYFRTFNNFTQTHTHTHINTFFSSLR